MEGKESKETISFDRVATGVVIWLVCQFAATIWWASNMTTRLTQIESNMGQTSEIALKLAKMEERLASQNDILCQIRTEMQELRKMKRYGGEYEVVH